MRKKFKQLITVSTLGLLMTTTVFASDSWVSVNGETLAAKGVTKNNRVLVPLRDIFEALGEEVSYEKGIITSKGIRLEVNKTEASVNGTRVQLDTPAEIIQGVTMVPIRFVTEALGAEVKWGEGGIEVTMEPPILECGLTRDELALANLINEYRISINKAPFTISKSLTEVARTHVKDSNENNPMNGIDIRGIQGNGHSWSDKGNWKPVTYTSDHKYAELMWSKPSELTSYRGAGFEISAWRSSNMTPNTAMKGWLGSPAHKAVIDGDRDWEDLNTMGVGIDGKYSHVWFGVESDPEGYYEIR